MFKDLSEKTQVYMATKGFGLVVNSFGIATAVNLNAYF